MWRYWPIITTIAVAVLASGCETGRHSASGFRLPDNGDAARGKALFAELKCTGCHRVSGAADLPVPAMTVAAVVLGGEKTFDTTDGYLVTSIINPRYKRSAKTTMPSYGEQMTVQQMTDLVAFLQTHYTRRALPDRYGYY
jgi:L-cysteine S-thiosulfotransferase